MASTWLAKPSICALVAFGFCQPSQEILEIGSNLLGFIEGHAYKWHFHYTAR